ncbi:MAG: BMC domain-containing protein [Bacteroidota bacterium]
MPAAPPAGSALGLLETLGLVAAVEAADAMLKTAEVSLVRQQRTNPGLVTHLVVGETAAVRAAVDAGAAAADRVGKVVARHVIPRPADDVWRRLVGIGPDSSALDPAGDARQPGDEYASMTVRDLRTLARERDHETFSGRAISRASKDDLVAFLRADDGRGS